MRSDTGAQLERHLPMLDPVSAPADAVVTTDQPPEQVAIGVLGVAGWSRSSCG